MLLYTEALKRTTERGMNMKIKEKQFTIFRIIFILW